MRFALSVLTMVFASAAAAHPSLLPHTHVNGQISMAPDLGTVVVAAIFLFAGALLAYGKMRGD